MVCDAGFSPHDVLGKLAPEKLPKLRELSDPQPDEVFDGESHLT